MTYGASGGRGAEPGWYADPSITGQLRWWDGVQWTAHAQPMPGFGYGYGGPRSAAAAYRASSTPQGSLDDERRAARLASSGLLFGAAAYVVVFVVSAVIYHAFLHSVLHHTEPATLGPGGATSLTPTVGSTDTGRDVAASTAFVVGSGVLQLVQLGLLAVGVLFLSWMHKASKLAEAAGLRLRHSPGMAVGGFLIPIVNWWFPYQSARDLFVPGDPRARTVGRWWALWLATQFGALPLVAFAFGPTALLVVVALAVCALPIGAAVAGRRVIAAVSEAHAELVAAALASPSA